MYEREKGGGDRERERKLLFAFSLSIIFYELKITWETFFEKSSYGISTFFSPFFTALNWGEDFSRRRNICAGKRGREKKIKCRHTPE